MRAKALKLNTLTTLLGEMVALVCGLILPRLILVNFGSNVNGLVSSITQFLSFSTVLRAGVGGVTRAALYKPLADNDSEQISAVMAATNSYMKKRGLIIAGGVVAFSLVYPFMVIEEYDWWYSCLMVLVLGAVTFAENFFGIKNMLLLQADQKMYIQNIASTISYFASFLASILLINLGLDMLIVKFGTLATFLLKPIFLEVYVRKNYKLDSKAQPNDKALKNRWDAFAQQLAIIINGNIDIVLITMFSALGNVSVYTVHCMVVNNIGKVVQSSVSGIGSIYGNMLAKGEKENLKRAFSFIEWGLFALSTVIFAVTAFMISPFVSIYTRSITDVDYHQPLFAFLLVVAMLLNTLRIPYQSVTEAAGHFKQTRNGSILEVIVHVIVSGVLLIVFGIAGVVVGAVVSAVIRTLQYSVYSAKNILGLSVWHIAKNYLVYFATFALCLFACSLIPITAPNDYLEWCLLAAVVSLVCFAIVIVASLIFNISDVKYLYARIFTKRVKKKQ